jgi:hypothetical protein
VTITFVMPVRNAAAYLPRCLQSIRAAAAEVPHELIVVDNGSVDGSAEAAARAGARVLSRPGLRVGAVRNAGATAGTGRVLAFVDADHEIDPGWVRACLGAMSEEDIAAVGFPCEPPSPPTWVQRMYNLLRTRPRPRSDVEWLGAGNMAVRRDVFESLGGFDESLEACEDVALCQDLRRAGYRLVAEPGMRNVHFGDPATLKALFVGELWRGRDNLRVSLRGRGISAVGVVMPVVSLTLIAAIVVLLLSLPWTGWKPLAAAAAGLIAVASIRTLAIIRRGRLGPADWLQSLGVALTFEVARGLALIGFVGHGMRRRAGVA